MTTTPEREKFEAALREKPEAIHWNTTDAMFWAWQAALAAARQSAPESCAKVDDCTESLCMQANRCKHTLPPQPQRLCVEQSDDRRDAERLRISCALFY